MPDPGPKLIPSVPGELRILAFGAPLVEGYTNYGRTFHPFSTALQRQLSALCPAQNIFVDVNGQSGDSVLETLGGTYLQRLQVSLSSPESDSPPRYDLVIILGGTNDLAHLVTRDDSAVDILEGLKKCYQYILSSGSNLLCLTVPERRIDTQSTMIAIKARDARLRLNALIHAYVRDHQEHHQDDKPSVYLWDLARNAPFSVVHQGLWSADGLHMSTTGYDFVGEEIAAFVYSIAF
jgi:lysophospholipase L1-like esterase